MKFPKNKFVRVVINSGFIAIWWLLMPDIIMYLNYYSGYFFRTILSMQNTELIAFLQNLLGLVVLILPIVIVTKYIWFPKRTKITKSKN